MSTGAFKSNINSFCKTFTRYYSNYDINLYLIASPLLDLELYCNTYPAWPQFFMPVKENHFISCFFELIPMHDTIAVFGTASHKLLAI